MSLAATVLPAVIDDLTNSAQVRDLMQRFPLYP